MSAKLLYDWHSRFLNAGMVLARYPTLSTYRSAQGLIGGLEAHSVPLNRTLQPGAWAMLSNSIVQPFGSRLEFPWHRWCNADLARGSGADDLQERACRTGEELR